MKRTPSILNQRQIDYLKRLVEIKFGKPLENRKDYSALYRFIKKQLEEIEIIKDDKNYILQGGEGIGENTIFRIWGYGGENEHQTDDTTYRKLASILGFNSLQTYINYYNAHHTDGPLFDPQSIKVEKLKKNEEIRLGWFPHHYLEVKYLGDWKFEVLKVVGEFRKKEGETFKAKKFTVDLYYSINDHNMGYPLYPNICAIMKDSNDDI